MKYLASLFFVVCALPITNTKVGSGTLIYLRSARDYVTVAADSRITYDPGEYNDDACKISAFGTRFVFAMAGYSNGTDWDVNSIARQIWNEESKSNTNARELVQRVP